MQGRFMSPLEYGNGTGGSTLCWGLHEGGVPSHHTYVVADNSGVDYVSVLGAATVYKPKLVCRSAHVSDMPQVKLFDLIKAKRYRGCERLIALNIRRLYLKRIRC